MEKHERSDSQPELTKPRAEVIQTELVRLPSLSFWRLLARRSLRALMHFLVWLLSDFSFSGQENIPFEGPVLVVSNHLGDADALLGGAFFPRWRDLEVVIKIELHAYPVLREILDAWGVIWIHRGQPDRRAIKAILKGLSEGRIVSIAPEGRESLTGGLEEGTRGAAYIALKANVPLLPLTFTGTENWRIYSNLKHFRRSKVTATAGPIFTLEQGTDLRASIDAGTTKIMQTLASQLPPEYQGFYSQMPKTPDDSA